MTTVAVNVIEHRCERLAGHEAVYSQVAFDALLVENGITIVEFQSVPFELAQSRAILTEAEGMEATARARVSGIAVEARLIAVSSSD
jgi:hypothetical protein